MNSFEFVTPTTLVMNNSAENMTGKYACKYGDKALIVHYGDGFIKKSGIVDRVKSSCIENSMECFELEGIVPNPVLSKVYEGIRLCREHNISVVVAIGGGSVIDTAKAIAVGAKYDGDVWELYTKHLNIESALDVGVIMTIPSTGSECSNGSVITNEQTGEKLDIMSDVIRPKFVMMNPVLTQTLPAKQTARGIVDMLSHAMERYFSANENQYFTDFLGEAVMKSTIAAANALYESPDDLNARAELMVDSIYAHNGLTGIGRAQDWACHTIGAPLSGKYNMIHADSLSAIIPSWAAFVSKKNPKRLAQMAVNVFGVERAGHNDDYLAQHCIECLVALYKKLDMPITLKQAGLNSSADFADIAKQICAGGKIGGYVPLCEDDVLHILDDAYGE